MIKQFCNLEPGERFKFLNQTSIQIWVKMLGYKYKAVGKHSLTEPRTGESIIYDMLIPFREVEVIQYGDDGTFKAN